MLDLEPLYRLVSLLPFECLQAGFMQQALAALILLAPMAATMGVQVVSFRMAFFSDAISHSAFAGVALGLIFSINPHVAMPVFGILVGLGIMAVQRNSALSSDTIIGVFFSAVMAFGLAVVSRDNAVARDLQQFLYGDILTITETDIRWLIGLFFALAAFQIWGYNRLLYIGLNSVVAKAHRINVFFWQYLFAGLLALVVMFSVWAVGVLLVTALLIVPAATENDEVVVNGMSLARRDSPFANAGFVVSVHPEDTEPFCREHGVLAGVAYQKALETAPCRAGGGMQKAPAQKVEDFLKGRVSSSLLPTSYHPGIVSHPLHELLPEGIVWRMREGLRQFDRKWRGFAGADAQLIGCEPRTSSPVRIPRDPATLEHPGLEGLYPCGEGAGYAGGIVSAALDGRRCAEAMAQQATR